MRGYLLIACGMLVACTYLLGQTPSSDADPAAAAKASASESEAEHGIYVSGFEIPNGGRNVKDLGFYPTRVLGRVRQEWYRRTAELQNSIARKRARTIIEFKINKDGSLGEVTTIESAGEVPLDAAASEAISSSAPFAHLPQDYHEEAVLLRMHFGYDQPASTEAPFCDGPDWGAHPAPYTVHHVGNGITAPKATFAPDPEYAEKARRDKYMSTVLIAGTVDPRGAFTDLCVAQAAGEELDEKAIEAVMTWKFDPATLQGEPVAVRIHVETSFRLY